MAGRPSSVAGQLGALAEAMDAVQAAITEIKMEVRAERTSAQQSRARLYNRMDDMGKAQVRLTDDVAGLREDLDRSREEVKADVENVNKQVAEVKKVTDAVTRWQLIVIGILAAASVALTGIGLIVTWWSTIKKWLP